jgi:hypothetical protein
MLFNVANLNVGTEMYYDHKCIGYFTMRYLINYHLGLSDK